MTQNFYQLFKENTIIQAVMALALGATLCYLAIVGREPPDYLVTAFMLILGFFFGSKSQAHIDRKAGG